MTGRIMEGDGNWIGEGPTLGEDDRAQSERGKKLDRRGTPVRGV